MSPTDPYADVRAADSQQRDLSTAKRVHHATIGDPSGPPKAARAMPSTPIPGGGPVMSDGFGSPHGGSPGSPGSPQHEEQAYMYSGGVTGETVMYASDITIDDAEVHHLVAEKIDSIVATRPEVGALELRDEVKSTLQRALSPAELQYMHDVLEKRERMASAEAGAFDTTEDVEQRRTQRRMELRALEEAENEQDRPVGVPESEWDADSAECYYCKKKFGMFRSRHHCRGCGRNVCDNDSGYKAMLPKHCGYGTKQERLCGECHSILKFRAFKARAEGVQ